MRCRGVSDGVEATGRMGERGGGFCNRVFFSGHVASGGPFAFALGGGPGGAGRLGVGGEVFWFEVWVEGGRGKSRQVIFAGAKLARFPGVGEGPCVEFGVAEHLLEGGVVEGAVYRRVKGAWVGGGLRLGGWRGGRGGRMPSRGRGAGSG